MSAFFLRHGIEHVLEVQGQQAFCRDVAIFYLLFGAKYVFLTFRDDGECYKMGAADNSHPKVVGFQAGCCKVCALHFGDDGC
eukprot:5067480-Ditylum_brightwellii.AAC.2